MKKNKIRLIIICEAFLIMLLAILDISYALYQKDIKVNVHTSSANMVCEAEIDNPGTYISTDGWAYFKLIIKNNDTSGNISHVPIQYNATIKNKNSSNAVYRYLDGFGNSNDFVDTFTTRNYKFSPNTAENQVINIEVKTNSTTSENVDFQVDVNCYQIEK